MSIADQFLTRGGVAFPIPKVANMMFSGGLRVEGVAVRDILGGDTGFRVQGRRVNRTRDQHDRREERRDAVGAGRDLPESIPERAGQGARRARRRRLCRLPDFGRLLPQVLSTGSEAGQSPTQMPFSAFPPMFQRCD